MRPMDEAAGGAKRQLTYEDYCAIPDDLQRHEILDGEPVVSPSPLTRHQRVLVNLLGILRDGFEPSGVGEVLVSPSDALLGPHTVVQPDLCVVLAAHFARIQANGCHGPPDLVIEILSPSNRAYDLVKKRRIYEAATTPLLPGFSLPLAEVFDPGPAARAAAASPSEDPTAG